MINSSEYYQWNRSEMNIFIPEQYSKILEIGCGEGNFRENLKKKNEYWAIEPVQDIAKRASEKLDKVYIGTYHEMEDRIPDNYFDLVVCNDVIEHMSDYEDFLNSIKNKLINDGSFIASIPNVRYLKNLFELLVKKDWEYKNGGILDKTHLRFFTKKSIVRTINENGFLVELIFGINPFGNNSILKYCISLLATLLFGRDVKYPQFGLRAKKLPPSE